MTAINIDTVGGRGKETEGTSSAHRSTHITALLLYGRIQSCIYGGRTLPLRGSGARTEKGGGKRKKNAACSDWQIDVEEGGALPMHLSHKRCITKPGFHANGNGRIFLAF